MDHHCPWIDNCVGFANHKFFLLLIAYGFLASAVAVACSAPDFMACLTVVSAVLERDGKVHAGLQQLNLCDVFLFIVFYGLAWAVLVGLGAMLIIHIRFALENLTSIEDNYEGVPNPYDQGSGRLNLEQILGVFGPDWFLPIRPRKPTTDGCSFTRKDECLDMDFMDESLDSPREDMGAERLWRIRYGVPSSEVTGSAKVGPMESFRRWWMGDPAVEAGHPLMAFSRAKRRNLFCQGCVRPSKPLRRQAVGGG
jgi:hypothetical protein